MAKPPIEGGEDRYPANSEFHSTYLEGREARMEGTLVTENPYRHQPHQKDQANAWEIGWLDEDSWALDSTGR